MTDRNPRDLWASVRLSRRLHHAQNADPAMVALHDEIRAGRRGEPWTVIDDMIAYSGHLYITPASPLLHELVAAVHEDGHEGVQRTLHHIRRVFHSPNLRRVVHDFVRACSTCQRYKSEHLHPAWLLLPLSVPSAVWTDRGLDFVEALPRVEGKFVILMVVDRFSKYCHFIPLVHPYWAESVAQAFFTDIVCLHGVPQSLVPDRDPIFTSTFWRSTVTAFPWDGPNCFWRTVFQAVCSTIVLWAGRPASGSLSVLHCIDTLLACHGSILDVVDVVCLIMA